MDAVGDILAAREDDRIPWSTGISLAVLLHAGIGAALLISSLSTPARFVPGRTLAVRLQSAGSLKGKAVDLAPGPAPAPAPEEAAKPRILKPADEVPPPPSEKARLLPAKELPKKNPPLPAYTDPKGRAATSTASAPSPPHPADAQPAAGAAGTGAGGSGNGVGGLTFD